MTTKPTALQAERDWQAANRRLVDAQLLLTSARQQVRHAEKDLLLAAKKLQALNGKTDK